MKKKIIIVTGGTGFIGSHLCEKLLLNNENHVLCVDNNFCGKIENIKHLLSNPNFEFIRHDVTQKLYIEADEIYHLACPASPKDYQYNSIKTLKTNFIGTLNMLGLAKRNKAKILFTSTSEVYGDPLVSPQNEEYWGNVNPIGIRSCYDEGKRVAESLMIEYHRIHNVDIRIVRIFNTFGPRLNENDGRVISNFIVQALNNKDITIYGDGMQTRSFCYVSDIVDGLIKIMDMNQFIGPINLGNPDEKTILETAEFILNMTNSSSKIVFLPLPQDDPKKRKPDITKVKKYINWEPKTSFKDGIEKTIQYFTSLKISK